MLPSLIVLPVMMKDRGKIGQLQLEEDSGGSTRKIFQNDSAAGSRVLDKDLSSMDSKKVFICHFFKF